MWGKVDSYGGKRLKFAECLGINDFKASQFCVSDVIKRNNKVGINLSDEANNMTDEKGR